MDEAYWGMDDYGYEMEAMARGRFGRNFKHEASKQARHESKRARRLQAKAERLSSRIGRREPCASNCSQRRAIMVAWSAL